MRPIRKFRIQRSGTGAVVFAAGCVAAAVASGLIYVWLVIQTQDGKDSILDLENRRSTLRRENARLTIEISRQSRQEEIAPIAMNALRLSYPMVGQIVAVVEPADAPVIHTMATAAATTPQGKGSRVAPVAAMPAIPIGKR